VCDYGIKQLRYSILKDIKNFGIHPPSVAVELGAILEVREFGHQ